MTTKSKTHPLNGMHTAGIFSDMSADGPEIGTLVLVVDRAKNLPNRKTIGKQDPYCAARLGKEAKKTTTDIRGGQTPKWDQELRFTVHDSPDYYQLKVSVFNDDKRTELIGEAWIDLRDIVVGGGGQSDQWHQLACRGKYAGEVRIEITYYDNRPKPERPVVKAKPPPQTEVEPAPAAAGPRPVPKRRPLPSDPITGKSPAPPSPVPEQGETPPRPQPNPAPVPHQQPEYYQQPDQGRELGTPPRRAEAPNQYRTPERPEQHAAQHDQGYSPHRQQPAYDRQESYEFPPLNDQRPVADDRPPPPPAHRSRTGSNPSMNAAFQATPPTMRQDVLRSEAHRNSVSGSYPGRPTYKAFDTAPAGLPGSQYSKADPGQPPRHYSYDAGYEQHRTMQATVEDVPESPESMSNPRRTSGRWPQLQPQSQSQPHLERDYDMTASPAPLALSGRSSSESAQYPQDPRHQGANGYPMVAPEIPQRESPDYAPNYGRHSEPSLPLHSAHSTQKALTYRGELDDTSHGFPVSPVPASLVPGIDPNIAQEVPERVSQDRRQSNQPRGYAQQALVETPPRGRTMNDGYAHDGTVVPYNAASVHGRNPVMYSNGPSTSSVNVVIKSRAYSPNPPRDPSPNPHHQHTIRRKSVSPRPPVESHQMSGIPFGPDSYEALNPNTSSAAVKDAASSRADYSEATGKIITHDGREVDPSDHLPMETWAPEPEPKQPTAAPARPSLAGPQPVPSSGRRPLRVAGRTQSMLPAAPSSSAVTFSGGMTDHVEPITTATATGRNRLQKKAAYRQSTSAIVPMMSGAIGAPAPGRGSSPSESRVLRKSSGSSGHGMEPAPLAPIPAHMDNFTAPRGIPRAATFDYATGAENHAPYHAHSHSGSSSGVYGTSPGSQRHAHSYGHSSNPSQHRGHSPGRSPGRSHQYSRSGGSVSGGGPPPIPAKVPLALPPPPSSSAPSANGGGMSGALQLHSSSVARRAGSGIDDGYHHHHHHHGGQQGYGGEGDRYGYGHDGYGYGGGGGGMGGGGGGGGGNISLEEELRQIDIGTGRSSRRHNAGGYAAAGGGGQFGAVYGQGGY
ncbi:uncharacterized protein B0H64DRAFT_356218 [Chaetomium fimeti]|uniref:C2 domain-containing protein n=1 Tax=Chaetomium fimeti TaxID=1854472 RepID=A0AAE0LTY9_9PEZI|nr:hypothetical protein B0H64DRAFT_356218 [Chaetomium fimeti]